MKIMNVNTRIGSVPITTIDAPPIPNAPPMPNEPPIPNEPPALNMPPNSLGTFNNQRETVRSVRLPNIQSNRLEPSASEIDHYLSIENASREESSLFQEREPVFNQDLPSISSNDDQDSLPSISLNEVNNANLPHIIRHMDVFNVLLPVLPVLPEPMIDDADRLLPDGEAEALYREEESLFMSFSLYLNEE